MVHLISFTTAIFDPSKERENPINPIAGESVLRWLADKVAENGYDTTEPDAEDWGWYIDVVGRGNVYLVGASGEPEAPADEIEWMLQVHKKRSLKEKLFGKNKLTPDDALCSVIEAVIRAEEHFRNVEIEKDA